MFAQIIPSGLLNRIDRWADLKRWERREVGQELRLIGLSYREIAILIPVAKGTLSRWCRDIELTPQQADRLEHARASQFKRNGVGRELRRRAVTRASALRSAAQTEARSLLADPDWASGVVAYWCEGAKRQKELLFANSDPGLIKLFVNWATKYLELTPDRFTAKLHLHSGQDESERKLFWSSVTDIPISSFRKTFIKPEGTGHRKNVLYNGTVQVRVTRSTDLLHRVMGWIQELASAADDSAKLSQGR